MAYHGSGTQDDPYIVDNWADLKEVSTTRNVYVRLDPDTENKVMDINDTEDAFGLSENLPFHAHIEGNGWTIRNLCTGGYELRTSGNNLSNLHFENLVSGNMRIFWGSIFCTNCTFTVVFLKHPMFSVPSGDTTLTGCSMQLYFSNTETGVLFYSTTKLQYCDIVLHGNVSGLSLVENGTMENCRVTGSLRLKDATLNLGSYNKTTSYNIIALELTGSGQMNSKYESNQLCLVDTDLIAEGITVSLQNGWQSVTTAQLQDAEYLLYTVGFPCAVVEG